MLGKTFPIKMQFGDNSITKTFQENEAWVANDIKSFEINENFNELKLGTVKLFERDTEEFLVENKSFKYKFDETSGLVIKFLSNPSTPSANLMGYDVTVSTGSEGQGFGVEIPVYSTTISAIPTIYDETFGICNYLDAEFNYIECITTLSDVTKMKIKLVSADPIIGGNIVLNFICGDTSFNQTVAVTTSKEYVEIILPTTLSGNLRIERLFNDVNDTLKDNNVVISAIITEIKVENA